MDNGHVDKIKNYLLNVIPRNKNKNATHDDFLENHKKLRSETKFLSDLNIIISHKIILHIDFDASIHSGNEPDTVGAIKQRYNQTILTVLNIKLCLGP